MLNLNLSRVGSLALCALMTVLTLLPGTSRAGGVDEAFDNLLGSQANISINQPGYYSSQARNSFVAGGAEVRFPNRRSPALFSVTPFQMSAGCGGVSAYFGGFSFVSGEEIKKLIEAVAQNSVGVAIELVMTTLCGQCAHVMQVMRSLAKDAAKLSIDSCEMARSLMQRGMTEMLGPDHQYGEKARATCASRLSDDNRQKDWIAATNDGLCNVNNAVDNLYQNVKDKLAQAGFDENSPEARKAFCESGGPCNTVWQLLEETNLKAISRQGSVDLDRVRAKLIIMNVMGTNIVCGGDAKCKEAAGQLAAAGGAQASAGTNATVKQPGVMFYPPQLGNVAGTSAEAMSMQDVFELFMCGTNYSQLPNVSAQVQVVVDNYCKREKGTGEVFDGVKDRLVWDCGDPSSATDSARYGRCVELIKVKANDSALKGSGYLPFVADLLSQGVTAVRSNSPMPDETIRLIQASPVPLYQAINAAAVYPDAGEQLVASMSVYVAQLLAYADVRDMIRQAEKLDHNSMFDREALDRVYAFLGGMRAASQKAEAQISQAMTMQQALIEQIRQVNLAMQREVMSEDLLGNTQYSTTLSGAAQQAAQGAQ